ncbi:hypothetical protein Golax_005044 [Gossypium laxum]|uniref:Uncharacterized protein n=1 Tax=Gossypium laxum TaxID=34288 RepID=A0A7J8ZZG2_9ROSI|nr:hypothetical protein [Gossypium laxum]
MVSLLHVSVPDPDWSFSDTFYLQLSGSLIYLIFTLAKALEGKITLKYTVSFNLQVVPSVINGAITALYFILWGKGLKSCGPLRAILAEYSGAVLGVLSAVLFVPLFSGAALPSEVVGRTLVLLLYLFRIEISGWWAYCDVGIFLFLISRLGLGNTFSILYPLIGLPQI